MPSEPRPTPLISDQPTGVDASFAVPFVHRLRFTEDVFGADTEVLAELLVRTYYASQQRVPYAIGSTQNLDAGS